MPVVQKGKDASMLVAIYPELCQKHGKREFVVEVVLVWLSSIRFDEVIRDVQTIVDRD